MSQNNNKDLFTSGYLREDYYQENIFMFCSMNNNLLKIGNNKYISHLFCNYCYKDMFDIYFARKNLNLSIKQQTCQNRKVEQFVRSEDTD